MKRARLNLVIDAIIGVAFLVTALTGVAFLLPASWQQAVLVGLSFHAWHWLHDWSGAVAAAGVTLHLALHWRWVVHTLRRWLADARGELPDRRPAAGRSPASSRAGTPALVAQASPHDPPARPERAQPQGRSGGRLTRRRFIVGAAGFGAAAIGGVALSRVAAAVGTDQTTAAGGTSTGQGAATGSSASGTTGASGGASSSGSGASSSGGGTTTTAARVVVDSSSCVACGRCLEVCPKSVFDWNSAGRATAASPDSCILCRHCVQVCPASAITLNA